MKLRRLALLLLILICVPGHALAFTALDGEGEVIERGTYVAPGAQLNFTCEIPEDLENAPALRLRLSGMALEEVTFQPAGTAGELPEIIYGSDGCILLFAEAAGEGDTIAFTATAQAEPGEARASLLMEGETIMEIGRPIGFAPTPNPDPAPVTAPLETVPEPPSPSWIPLIVLLAVLVLAAVGYWVVWPRVSGKLKMKKEK